MRGGASIAPFINASVPGTTPDRAGNGTMEKGHWCLAPIFLFSEQPSTRQGRIHGA
jgi:hypothetical protein